MRHPWSIGNRLGQGTVEYLLLLALVAACLVAILGLTRNAAGGAYTRTSAALAPAGFNSGGGVGSAGGTWRPGHDDGSRSDPDSTGLADPGGSGGTTWAGTRPARGR